MTAKTIVGRLAPNAWRTGDPLPEIGSICLVSGANCDVESDQHRSYMWRKVVGYGEGDMFVCLQTEGCWPTVERTENCWFAEIQVGRRSSFSFPAAQGLSDEERERVKEAVRNTLGDAYDCTRVWEAWCVGTMSQDDFALVAEADSRVAEIADAAINALLSGAATAAEPSKTVSRGDDTMPQRGTLAWLICLLQQLQVHGTASEAKVYINDPTFGRVEVGGALYGIADVELTPNDDDEGEEEAAQQQAEPGADEPSEIESVIACLGDDAARLREAGDEWEEVADNMDAAARLLEGSQQIEPKSDDLDNTIEEVAGALELCEPESQQAFERVRTALLANIARAAAFESQILAAQSGQRGVAEDAHLFYMQDTRQFVGNCVMWWAKDRNGYVSRLDRAGKYTREDAEAICRNRGTDRMWPCSVVNPLAGPTVDFQVLPKAVPAAAATAQQEASQ